MIRLKIDLLKITGARTFTAKDGSACIAFPLEANNVYITPKGAHNLTLTLMDNKQGRDQYDQDGFCTVDVGKDRRLAGERGPILGNWADLDRGQRQGPGRDVSAAEATRRTAPAPAQATQPDDEETDIPF
jgi:hypothetical protein